MVGNINPITQSLELKTNIIYYAIYWSHFRSLQSYQRGWSFDFASLKYFHFIIWIIYIHIYIYIMHIQRIYNTKIFMPIYNHVWLWKSKNKFRPPVCFNSYVDYDDVSVMKFHSREHFCLRYYVFTYCTGTSPSDKNFMRKDKDL